jgi:hypothetical protein
LKTLLTCIQCLALLLVGLWNTVQAQTNSKVKDDSTCGAKCLYVVLRGYGVSPRSYKTIVEELGPAKNDGYSLLQIRDVARNHGMFAECVQLDKKSLERFASSASVILHLTKVGGKDRGHYVICEGVNATSASIIDASSGAAVQISHEIFLNWSGNALILSRDPIDLSSSSSSSGRSVWLVLCGICLVCVVATLGIVVLARLVQAKKRFGIGLILFPLVNSGCSRDDDREIERVIARGSGEQNRVGLPPIASGVWVEQKDFDMGPLRRESTPLIVPVKLYNSESKAVSIQDVRYTCSCLFGELSNKTIPPRDSVECRLILDRSKLGVKNAKAVIFSETREQVTITAKWSVIASLRASPEALNGIELPCGSSIESWFNLIQLEPFDFSKLVASSSIDNCTLGKDL